MHSTYPGVRELDKGETVWTPHKRLPHSWKPINSHATESRKSFSMTIAETIATSPKPPKNKAIILLRAHMAHVLMIKMTGNVQHS